jgi:hypothetical protein
MKRKLSGLFIVACLLMLAHQRIAQAEVPYVFEPGSPIRAAELNANFAYLESLSASQGAPQLERVVFSVSLATPVPVAVFQVPADASRPYILRSGHYSYCPGGLYLSNTTKPANFVNASFVIPPNFSAGGSFGGSSGLEIPFLPGETVYALCLNPFAAPAEIWLVFSK